MMLTCNDIVIIEHDGRRPGHPSAPVDVEEHDNNRPEILPSKHSPCPLT